jgi:enoyl-CoA hydratase/carnithine racemase
VRVDGPLATVVLDGEAGGPALWAALAEAGRRLPGSVRVVLLGADGPGWSAATVDRTAYGDEPEQALAAGQQATGWLARPDTASIAVVHGRVAGSALELALACDLRIAAAGTELSLPDAAAGLVPALGATSRLVGLLGPARALELCLTGRRVAADEALAWGLLTAVVPRAALDAAARDLALAVLAAPRAAVIETKALLQGAVWRTPERQCEAEREAQARLLLDPAPDLTGE